MKDASVVQSASVLLEAAKMAAKLLVAKVDVKLVVANRTCKDSFMIWLLSPMPLLDLNIKTSHIVHLHTLGMRRLGTSAKHTNTNKSILFQHWQFFDLDIQFQICKHIFDFSRYHVHVLSRKLKVLVYLLTSMVAVWYISFIVYLYA